jgi:hypothetical protein
MVERQMKNLIFLSLILICCSSNKPLEERGMSKEQRVAYINKKGQMYPQNIKDAFINKSLTIGFDKRLVLGLFGKPNENYGDTLWWYSNSIGDGILKIEFKNGIVSSLSY